MFKVSEKQPFIEVLQCYLDSSLEQQKTIGIALIKLTNVVDINQSYGYEIASQLLREAYARLEEISKSESYLYRTGTHEFALIMPFLANEIIVKLAAAKIETSLMAPYVVNEEEMFLSLKMGLSFSNSSKQTAGDLSLTSERALAEAIKSNETYIIKATSSNESPVSLELHSTLKKAINNSEFELYLEPQVELGKGSCISLESLIRWKHNHQYITPELFFTYAEKNELIFPITKWTLNNALRQLQSIKAPYEKMTTSVNISAACFDRESFVSEVTGALNIWGVSPERLTLEITEMALMKDLKKTQKLCQVLRNEVGVKISIDHFGIGFTNFEFFKQLSADELKIDKSFTKDITTNSRGKHIVNTMIALAHGIDLRTVAEGIDDIESLIELSKMGCNLGQGYFIAKPFAEKNLNRWLESNSRLIRGVFSSHILR
jgi:diguanylate cyclase (GGDEF)-like protein